MITVTKRRTVTKTEKQAIQEVLRSICDWQRDFYTIGAVSRVANVPYQLIVWDERLSRHIANNVVFAP